jgi:gamma-glutamyl-gamma-aminobutyrate hydrolase PuuD
MKQKLRIGIPGASMGDQSWGVSKDILAFAERFGEPVILIPRKDIDETVNALLLPGGMDVNPASYNDAPSFYAGNLDVFKQYFFEKNLPAYIDKGVPVFGICLGFQQLAVYLGLPLCQHLRYHPYSDPPSVAAHYLYPTDEGMEYVPGYSKIPKNKQGEVQLYVNSTHHQALMLSSLKDADPAINLLATSACEDFPDDEIVEAFEHEVLPIGGVQWHPERFIYNDYGFAINLAEKIFSKVPISVEQGIPLNQC